MLVLREGRGVERENRHLKTMEEEGVGGVEVGEIIKAGKKNKTGLLTLSRASHSNAHPNRIESNRIAAASPHLLVLFPLVEEPD